MQTSALRAASLRVIAIGVAMMLTHSVVPLAHGIDCRGGNGHLCQECCCGPGTTPEQCASCTAARPRCCSLTNPFGNCSPTPIFAQVASVPAVKLNAFVGGVKLVFKRKGGPGGVVDFKFKESLLGTSGKPKPQASIAAQLTGVDAAVGSLLYPVAFLMHGANALQTLQGYGYDIDVSKAGAAQTCQSTFPDDWCAALARQLAQSFYAMIQLGDDGARAAFLQGIQQLGHRPCECGTCFDTCN